MLTETTKQNGVVVSVSSTDGAGSWKVDCVEIDGLRLPPCQDVIHSSASAAKAAGIAWGEAFRTAQKLNKK
ncbi:hypothetical protein [Pseudomonas putida]